MSSIFTIFKSEDIYGIEIPSYIFEEQKDTLKYKINPKETLIDILLFMETGYKIILPIKNFSKEKSKFSLLKKIRLQLEQRMSKISILKTESNLYDRPFNLLNSTQRLKDFEFEENDKIKFFAFEKAIKLALKSHPETGQRGLSIMVIGVGRGAIVSSLATALIKSNCIPQKIFLLEKNQNCKFSLKNLVKNDPNINQFFDEISILYKDVSELEINHLDFSKMDIVISDRFGAIGCDTRLPEKLEILKKK